MKKKGISFYNVIFPIWLVWLFPWLVFIVLPANFIIDFCVVIIAMKILKLESIFKKALSSILLVWIFGFIADLIGVALLFVTQIVSFDSNENLSHWWNRNISNPIAFNPFSSVLAFLIVTIVIVLVGALIYIFNTKICLKKLDISLVQKKKIALSLAVFTAPYLFYLPTIWFVTQ